MVTSSVTEPEPPEPLLRGGSDSGSGSTYRNLTKLVNYWIKINLKLLYLPNENNLNNTFFKYLCVQFVNIYICSISRSRSRSLSQNGETWSRSRQKSGAAPHTTSLTHSNIINLFVQESQEFRGVCQLNPI